MASVNNLRFNSSEVGATKLAAFGSFEKALEATVASRPPAQMSSPLVVSISSSATKADLSATIRPLSSLFVTVLCTSRGSKRASEPRVKFDKSCSQSPHLGRVAMLER